MLDMVLDVTKEKRLQYIGYSLGTLVLFGLLSERPEYNLKASNATWKRALYLFALPQHSNFHCASHNFSKGTVT